MTLIWQYGARNKCPTETQFCQNVPKIRYHRWLFLSDELAPDLQVVMPALAYVGTKASRHVKIVLGTMLTDVNGY